MSDNDSNSQLEPYDNEKKNNDAFPIQIILTKTGKSSLVSPEHPASLGPRRAGCFSFKIV